MFMGVSRGFKSMSRVFHECFKGVSIFLLLFLVVLMGIEICFKVVQVQGCFNDVSRLFQDLFKDVLPSIN